MLAQVQYLHFRHVQIALLSSLWVGVIVLVLQVGKRKHKRFRGPSPQVARPSMSPGLSRRLGALSACCPHGCGHEFLMCWLLGFQPLARPQ